MPTYTWRCAGCDLELECFLSIREYIANPPAFVHCNAPMARRLLPTMLINTNDAAYKDLRASDGTDISSRTKHRQYMKERGLTTMDDFKGTWEKEAQARYERLHGAVDPSLKQDIVQAVQKLEAGYVARTGGQAETSQAGWVG